MLLLLCCVFRGPSFRKSFEKLGDLVSLFPRTPHLALTATASPKSIKDLADVLQFREPKEIVTNPDRPNIFLDVRQRPPNLDFFAKHDFILRDLVGQLETELERFPVSIVYCDSLQSVGYCYQYTANRLGRKQYFPAGADTIPENRLFAQYHKDSTDDMKRQIVSELQKPQPTIRLVFATVALGMGLNAPSVRRIVHERPPTSMEKYAQEIGRCGRTGENSEAIVYFNNSDVASNRKGLHPAVKSYVESNSCLRQQLVHYFGFSNVLFCGSPTQCCCICRSNHVN